MQSISSEHGLRIENTNNTNKRPIHTCLQKQRISADKTIAITNTNHHHHHLCSASIIPFYLQSVHNIHTNNLGNTKSNYNTPNRKNNSNFNNTNHNKNQHFRHFSSTTQNESQIEKDKEKEKRAPKVKQKQNSNQDTVKQSDILQILYQNVWPRTREGRYRSMAAVSLMLSAKLATLSVPFVFKRLIDSMTITTASTMTAIPIGLIFCYGLARSSAAVFRESQNAIFAHVTQHGTRDTAVSMFNHLHKLDLEFHLNKQTGVLSKAIDRGVRGITYICNTMLLNVFPTIFEVTLVCGVLGYKYGTPYALTTSVTLATYVLFTLYITQRRTRLRQQMNKLDNESSSHVIDSLMNYETVKYFNNEEYESGRYSNIMDKYKSAAIKVQTSLSSLNAGQNVIFSTGLTVMMYLACQDLISGTNGFTIGDLVMVNTLLFQLSVPLNFIGSVYREVKLALTDLETMVDLLKRRSRELDFNDKLLPSFNTVMVDHNVSPNIVFDNVSFTYPEDLRNIVLSKRNYNNKGGVIEPDGKGGSLSTIGLEGDDISDDELVSLRPVLSNVSFSVEEGSKFAIVGGSGCGKSTILRLLYRFYQANSGKIMINGLNIYDYDINSIRKCIGVVPQDIVLFNDTLLHNIGYGNVNASLDEIIDVSKKAKLHDFIVSLPNQYDTMCGERGLKLSGGEKQRVAIARMLLKNSNIVLCDEATSALDSKTEMDIMQNIKDVTQNKTTIFVAHRLSSIMDSDIICVMRRGNVVEMGNHEQLLAQQGTYYNMWQLQSTIPGQ